MTREEELNFDLWPIGFHVAAYRHFYRFFFKVDSTQPDFTADVGIYTADGYGAAMRFKRGLVYGYNRCKELANVHSS